MKVYEVIIGESSNSFREKSIKLADMIQMSGENKRMKGHGHSCYTKLVYKAAGIKYKKVKNKSFRQTLSKEELERVEEIEERIIEMLCLDMNYDEIKPIILGIQTNV